MDDRAGQLVFDHEDVPELAVVRLRPEMVSVRRVDELGSDPHGASLSPDTALEDTGDGQLLSDGPNTKIPSLEREGGGGRDDVKASNVGERVNNFLVDPVGEYFVFFFPPIVT